MGAFQRLGLQEGVKGVKRVALHWRRILNIAIARGSGASMMLSSMSAEQRVAALLLDRSDRWQARGYSISAFALTVTRGEIGTHLGLKTETVNRVLQGMHKRGIIEVYASEIHILDLPSLILL
ncbi:helix-turn-helix domain-containing protein [Trinickia sp. Y13]|uniref:helix-turn-helix domain-containing protein n=1 Tax=Trinickia sp. Y13 TaxID=2917807 RepID=UPI002405CB47|nr:helix-turn-helix domain-containing protein [Trinickia sp. Y13]MDG0024355.1 helix-turn-helix domain-containing protein [Trinickia sp. Y13]